MVHVLHLLEVIQLGGLVQHLGLQQVVLQIRYEQLLLFILHNLLQGLPIKRLASKHLKE